MKDRGKYVFRMDTIGIKSFFVYLIAAVGMFYYVIPSGRYKLSAMLMCVIGIAYLAFVLSRDIQKNVIRLIIGIGLIAVMFFFVTYPFNFENALGIITQQFLYIFPIFILYYSQKYQTSKKFLMLIVCVAIIYVGFTTWVALNINPSLARLLAAGVDSVTEDLSVYRLANIGGFGFSYGMLFVSIAAFWNWDRNKKTVLNGLFLVFSTLFVIKTQYLTAILLMFISYFFILITKKNVGIKKVFVFIVIIIAYFILPGLLRLIADQIDASAIAQKLLQIADLMSFRLEFGQTSGGIYGRFWVFGTSINSFFASPIWGNNLTTGTNIVGEHSTFLDLGAKTGLIGQFAYIMCIIQIWNIMEYSFEYNKMDGRKIVPFIMIPYIVLSILNPTLNIFEISFFSFFICPFMIMWGNKVSYSYD